MGGELRIGNIYTFKCLEDLKMFARKYYELSYVIQYIANQ